MTPSLSGWPRWHDALQVRAARAGLVIDGEVTVITDQTGNGSAGTVHHQEL